MRTAAGVLALSLLAVPLLAGCGGSEQASAPAASGTLGTSASSAAPAAPSRECTIDDVQVSGKFGEKPTITIPDTCSPPKKLVSKDLSPGDGPAAAKGNTLTANYLLTTWSDKQVADNSFDRGQPYPVQNLGQAQVIDGWNEGLIGMKQGARRLLLVPPDKGYGEGGNGIAPNETLAFVIDAVKVSADG